MKFGWIKSPKEESNRKYQKEQEEFFRTVNRLLQCNPEIYQFCSFILLSKFMVTLHLSAINDVLVTASG